MTQPARAIPISAFAPAPTVATPVTLSAARLAEATSRRTTTGIAELDRVLGGGFVDGSVILLGGDPGVGKSTLLMQALHALANLERQTSALYTSGEESTQQIAIRAERLGIENEAIAILAEPDVDRVIELAERMRPTVLAVDSIQTMKTSELDSDAGSLAQVRQCAQRLARFAKDTSIPVILIGHVTKDGAMAGPKTLEHLVDGVLYLEHAGGARRHLVSPKNRYGSTDEVGLFEMRTEGLSCLDANAAHGQGALAERAAGVPGSAVFPATLGERVQLVEIQALVGGPRGDDKPKGQIAVSGIDLKRVQMILAVLQKHAACDVSDRDVFVSVTGGVRLSDPAADLPIALAIASSARDLPIDERVACFGELGLAGELRSVALGATRIAEARRCGLSMPLAPVGDARSAGATPAKSIAEAIELVIGVAVAATEATEADDAEETPA